MMVYWSFYAWVAVVDVLYTVQAILLTHLTLDVIIVYVHGYIGWYQGWKMASKKPRFLKKPQKSKI